MQKIAKITIEQMSLDQLKAHPENPRKHPGQNSPEWEGLKKSLEHDYFDPIVWNRRNGLLVSGHLRTKVLIDAGYTEADVSVVDYDDDTHLARMLAANKLQGSNDEDALAKILFDINDILDIELAGFTDSEAEAVFHKARISREVKEDGFDAEEALNEIDEPVTKLGDLYILGRHRLICGDATDPGAYNQLLDGRIAQLVFTDPPYNVDYRSPGGLTYSSDKFVRGGAIFNDNLTDEQYLEFCTKILKNLNSFSTDDASIYWWLAIKHWHINRAAWEAAGWHLSQTLIWLKNSMILSRGQDYHRLYEPCMFGWKKGKAHYRNTRIADMKDVFSLDYDDFKRQFEELFDVWLETRDNTQEYVHPTQKPVRLAERALKKNTRVGDVVIDVFGGSGSTLICCEQMDRVCCSMELDPRYCDVIIRRWEEFTGRKAERHETTRL
ncbi:MAG: DNA methyltransferase [Armatimonadota bacterium]